MCGDQNTFVFYIYSIFLYCWKTWSGFTYEDELFSLVFFPKGNILKIDCQEENSSKITKIRKEAADYLKKREKNVKLIMKKR